MFEKGHSGNPGGRPKIPEELKIKLREGAWEAVSVWLKIMRDEEAPKRERLKAGELLYMYCYGKPIQPMALEDADGNSLQPALVNITFESARE